MMQRYQPGLIKSTCSSTASFCGPQDVLDLFFADRKRACLPLPAMPRRGSATSRLLDDLDPMSMRSSVTGNETMMKLLTRRQGRAPCGKWLRACPGEPCPYAVGNCTTRRRAFVVHRASAGQVYQLVNMVGEVSAIPVFSTCHFRWLGISVFSDMGCPVWESAGFPPEIVITLLTFSRSISWSRHSLPACPGNGP